MSLLSLIIKMGMDASGLEAGIGKANRAVTGLSNSINSGIKGKLAAAFGAAAIGAGIHNAVEYGSRIHDMGVQLGVSTEYLQGLDYAATQNGATLEDFAGVLNKIGVNRKKALMDPGGQEAQSFQKLGVSIDDLKTKRLEDLLSKIGNKFRDATDPQKLLADSIAVMGRSAPGVFTAMISGLDEARREALGFGRVLSDDVVDKMDDIGDNADRNTGKIRAMFASAASFGVGIFGKGLDLFKTTLDNYTTMLGEQWGRAENWKQKAKVLLSAVGGSSLTPEGQAAAATARAATQKQVDEQVSTEMEADKLKKERREKMRKLAESGFDSSDINPPAEKFKLAKQSAGSKNGFKLTENQQNLGAFVDPIFAQSQKDSLNTLVKIEKNTRANKVAAASAEGEDIFN